MYRHNSPCSGARLGWSSACIGHRWGARLWWFSSSALLVRVLGSYRWERHRCYWHPRGQSRCGRCQTLLLGWGGYWGGSGVVRCVGAGARDNEKKRGRSCLVQSVAQNGDMPARLCLVQSAAQYGESCLVWQLAAYGEFPIGLSRCGPVPARGGRCTPQEHWCRALRSKK